MNALNDKRTNYILFVTILQRRL